MTRRRGFGEDESSVYLWDPTGQQDPLFYEFDHGRAATTPRGSRRRFACTDGPVALVRQRYLLALKRRRGNHTHDIFQGQSSGGRVASIPEMPVEALRYATGCATHNTPNSGDLFIVGGRDTRTNRLLSDVAFLTSSSSTSGNTNQQSTLMTWTALPSLHLGRRDASIVHIGNKLYVIGGYYWDRETATYKDCPFVEIYDPITRCWTYGPATLNKPRQKHCSVVLNNNIIVILGGVTKLGNTVREVEVWNTNMDSFVVIGDLPMSSVLITRSSAAQDITSGLSLYTTPSAFVRYNRDIYCFNESLPVIDKITMNLDMLTVRSLSPLVTETTAAIPNIPNGSFTNNANTTVPVLTNHLVPQQKPLATKSPKFDNFSNVADPATLVHASQPQWVPSPPVRPVPPAGCKTLATRYKAMGGYLAELEMSRDSYQLSIHETTQKITNYYERLRDNDIELMQFVGASWLNETERLLQEARAEQKRQELTLEECQNRRQQRGENNRSSSSDNMVNMLKCADEDDFSDGVPSQLRCPITLSLMVDPVIAADGNVYEKKALEQWFSRQSGENSSTRITSPLSGKELANKQFFPCHTLRDLCQKFRDTTREQPRL